MTKLQIDGKHVSYSIIELNEVDALYLQNIMESALVNYDKIFFERKDFKKLGFSAIEEIPVVSKINGFYLHSTHYSILILLLSVRTRRKCLFALLIG